MKFLVLMAEDDHYAKWEGASPDEQSAAFEAFGRFHAAVSERGSVLAGEALGHPSTARTVRGPEREATEGPFAETLEQIGGFFLVDLPDLDTAVELARLLPPTYTLEVRPATES